MKELTVKKEPLLRSRSRKLSKTFDAMQIQKSDARFTSQQFFIELVKNHYEFMKNELFEELSLKSTRCYVTQYRCEFILSECDESSQEWQQYETQINDCIKDEFLSANTKFGTWTELYETLRENGIFLPPTQSRLLRNSKNDITKCAKLDIDFSSIPKISALKSRAYSENVHHLSEVNSSRKDEHSA